MVQKWAQIVVPWYINTEAALISRIYMTLQKAQKKNPLIVALKEFPKKDGYSTFRYFTECTNCKKHMLLKRINEVIPGNCVPCRLRASRTGQKFNKLTILSVYYKVEGGKLYCDCQCDCGILKKGMRLCHVVDGSSKSCGCYLKESENFKKAHLNRTLPDFLGGKKALHKRYQYDRRGYVFELSFEEFIDITSSDCFYCGSPPSRKIGAQKSNAPRYTYNGIDRQDNNIGYVSTNVVPCCFQCNNRKSNSSLPEFIEWVSKLYDRFTVLGLINKAW